MSFPLYEKYKDSGVEWLGEMPGGWEVRRIKTLFEICKRISGEEGYDVLSITQQGIRGKDTESGDGQLSMDYSKYQFVEIGDFAMNHMDLLTGYVDISVFFGVTSPDYRVFRFKNKDICSDRYYLYLFQNAYKRRIFFPYGQGSSQLGRWRLPTDEFNSFCLPFPSIHEQQAIAAFLDRETGKIDALVAEQEHLIELLKENRQAVISHAVTKGLNPDAPMKDSGIEWLGEVPEGWEVPRLGKVAVLQGGYAFSADTFGVEGVPVVRMNNLKRGVLDLEGAACIPQDDVVQRVLLRVGDLLWGMSGSLGETGSLGNFAIIREQDLPCLLNQRVGRFLVKQEMLLIAFLVYFIQSLFFYEQILLLATGTAQFNVSSEQVQSTRTTLPPIPEQQAIVAFLDTETTKINTLITEVQQAIGLLKERRSALISAAVIGKIDVRGVANER